MEKGKRKDRDPFPRAIGGMSEEAVAVGGGNGGGGIAGQVRAHVARPPRWPSRHRKCEFSWVTALERCVLGFSFVRDAIARFFLLSPKLLTINAAKN